MAKKEPSLELLRVKVEGYLNLVRIHRELEGRASALLEEEGVRGITLAQATALLCLVQEREATTAARLAALLNVSPVTVGRFVRSLEDNGWIRRRPDPADARAMLLEPTRKTSRMMPRLLRVTDRLMGEAYAGFSQADVRKVVRLLARSRGNLYEAAGKEDLDAPVQLV